MIRLRTIPFIAAIVVSIGCWSAAEPSAGSVVDIYNASTVALSDVRVSTGPDDLLAESSIAPNSTSPVHSAELVYANVHVTAKANGQAVNVIPIEGFLDGFNQRLANGRYTVVLMVHAEDAGYWMEASVTQTSDVTR